LGRRCKYDPVQVVDKILTTPLLFRVCEVVFTSPKPLHSTEVGKRLNISQGYAYNMLAKLEKWGIVEPLRDPMNGKTMFRPSSRSIARRLAEEIRKRKSETLVARWADDNREEK